MGKFWQAVNGVIEKADVLLLLLDARFISETRNEEIENKVRRLRKPLIYVITKCDLVKDKTILEQYKKHINPSVFVSARNHLGTTILRDRIMIEAKKAYTDKYRVYVGVLGYPNVGKSSLINALKGKSSAPVSRLSGFTKGIMNVKADNRLWLIDTPGVIPYQEKDNNKHVLIGAVDFTKAKEPDMVVMDLMIRFPGRIEKFYGVAVEEDKEETLEKIALKRNILKKGAEPDLPRMSRVILRDWQEGDIK